MRKGWVHWFRPGSHERESFEDMEKLVSSKADPLSKLSTTARLALTGVAEGTLIYDLTLHKLTFWNGTAWEVVTSV